MDKFLMFLVYAVSNIINYGPWIIYMFSVPRTLHMFQLESYNYKDYFNWLSKNGKNAFSQGLRQFFACGATFLAIILINILTALKSPASLIGAVYGVELLALIVVFLTTNIIQIVRDKKNMKNAKKQLKYTARAKRLMFWNFIVMVFLEVIFTSYIYSGLGAGETENVTDLVFIMQTLSKFALYSAFIAVIPINMIIANFFAWPTEQNINNWYISSARRKLRKKNYRHIIRIGITGSYGKTSTKFALATILSEKYNVLATPESYNTTMGNVRVIREQLKPEHQVFISEMGARRVGDISEICDFVKPQIGIITSIGPQHLETFKTIEKVTQTKAELINTMDSDGVVFLPIDNQYCSNLYSKEKKKKYSYSLNNKVADVYAKDIVLNENGSNFIAVTPIGEISCTTKLLGEHNIENILGCIAITIHMGLSKEQIEAGVRKIEPVPHRLQILKSGNGNIVIDDAFNSNPTGSKMALEVLNMMPGKKIIVTPGMIELGPHQYDLNYKFGEYIADVCDEVILIGEHQTKPIYEGLISNNYSKEHIFILNDVKEAFVLMEKLKNNETYVLLENDLPDLFNE